MDPYPYPSHLPLALAPTRYFQQINAENKKRRGGDKSARKKKKK